MNDSIPSWDVIEAEGPIIATAIHHGHTLRPEVAMYMDLKDSQRLREEDPYTEHWTHIGDTRLVVHRSRFEMDLNRPRERAVYLKEKDAWGLRVWKESPPTALIRRSIQQYDEFYSMLYELLERKRRCYGHFIVLDLHTYNHRRQGPFEPEDDPALNPEINVGTEHVDQQLARINQSFDLLLLATPINPDSSWNRFLRDRFEKIPSFHYRPLPIDPALVKRRLFQIPIERVEDPTLAFLFREKRMELDRQLTMLLDRGKSQFLYGSLQLYGGVSADLLNLAEQILSSISSHKRESGRLHILYAKDFAEQAKAEIDYYRQLRPEVNAEVQVRNDVAGVIVSQGNLLIGESFSVSSSRSEALLQHEVGTHVLTYLNGQAQPFKQLCYGLAGYDALQEGIAVLAEFLTEGLTNSRLRLIAGRVVAAHCLIEGASFVETFRVLNKTYGFKQQVSYGIALRVHRGGGLTKDSIYLQGLASLLDYIKDGGDMDLLWIGKVALEHLPVVRELLNRRVLNTAPLKPRYLCDSKSNELLEQLRKGASPLDLIEGKIK